MLTESTLSAAEKLSLRNRIGAAAADDVAGNSSDIDALQLSVATAEGAISTLEDAVDALEVTVDAQADAIAANSAAIAATAYRQYVETTDDDPILTELQWLEAFIGGLVVSGVSSVAGLSGAIGSGALRAAINVANGADVTTAASVGSALGTASEKLVPADDDELGGRDSEAAGALIRFKISTIVDKVLSEFSGVFATVAQGAKADTAVQPETDAVLATLQLEPVALASLPEASEVGAGVVANITDGSVETIGEVALPGGSLAQRVRSDGAFWLVDSGVTTVVITEHAELDGLSADDHPQYSRTDGTRPITGMQRMQGIRFNTPTILTLANDACTATQTLHFIAAQTGTTDTLSTLTAPAGVGDLLILAADVGDTITVAHGTGNIETFNGEAITMTRTSPVILIRMGTSWLCFRNSAATAGPSTGGGLNPTITDHFGGASNDLDSLNSASYAAGESISFRDSAFFHWTYVLRAGTLPGGTIGSVNTTANTIGDAVSTDFLYLAVGDRILLHTTGTLPSPLTPNTIYYVHSKPTTTTATLSTGTGSAIDITTAGTGTHVWSRYLVPDRVRPADYNAATRAFYWQRIQERWDHFMLSFAAFPGSVNSGPVFLARHPFPFQIIAWGVSVEVPIANPGSGGAAALSANLYKSGSTNVAYGGPLSAAAVELTVGEYYRVVNFSKQEHVIQVNAGEALRFQATNPGATPPQGLDVFLWCRRDATFY